MLVEILALGLFIIMKKYSIIILFIAVFLICIIGTIIDTKNKNNTSKQANELPYRLDYYLDTIDNHIIQSTVVYNPGYGTISVSSIELKD